MYSLLLNPAAQIVFWMPSIEFFSFYGTIMRHWRLRQALLTEMSFSDELPANWADCWFDYKYAEGVLLHSPASESERAQALDNVYRARVLIDSYKRHIRVYAEQGLPTTFLGVQKLEALNNMGSRWLAGTLDEKLKADWERVCQKLWPEMTTEQATQHVIGLHALSSHTAWALIERGSLV